jgi:hypothetical protein
MTRGQADTFVNQYAAKDLGKLLLAMLAAGAATRGAVGVYGNIARNLRRKRDRDLDEKPRYEISLPVKSALFDGKPRPDWFAPAAVIGPPLAGAAGWAGMGKLMKTYRRHREQQELDKAKQEFEDALAEERTLKFSVDLHALAEAYEQGELNETLGKVADWIPGSSAVKAVGNVGRGIKPTAITIAAIMAGLGAYGGWRMVGAGDQADELKAYREAQRRRRAERPVSLMARPQVESHTQTDDDEEEKPNDNPYRDSDLSKTAYDKRAAIGRALRHLGTSAGTGLGLSWLMTNTDLGRRWASARTKDLMKDPKFMRSQTQHMLSNPHVMGQIYQQMMPAITQRMTQQRPVVGRLMAYLLNNPRQQQKWPGYGAPAYS